MTRPFNEHLLWKSKMERSKYIPFQVTRQNPPMELPEVNSIVGGTVYNSQIYEDICKSYEAYSAAYWRGVRHRQAEYRKNRSNLDSAHFFN